MSDKKTKEVQEQVKVREDFAGKLDDQVKLLTHLGGFAVLDTTIQDAKNLNPTKKALREIFLKEDSNAEKRLALKKRLEAWHELLSGTESVVDMIISCEEKTGAATSTLKVNLKKAVEETLDLERSYRTVALFYKNTESSKLKNVSIVNAAPDQLRDLDNTLYADFVEEELHRHYDRLDLRGNYSILVVPGYFGSQAILGKWARIAHKNKVMLVTDFRHLESPDDVIDLFESANHTGGDAYLANTIMTCNWLVGRPQDTEIGEESPLYVPPSAALAGKVHQTLMSQVTAGKKFGEILGTTGVTFELKKTQIANLEKIGMVPMVFEYSKVMAFSAKTLFNGSNLGLQTYSVVRVFDWVTKVLIDFLNRRAFENFNGTTKAEIRTEIGNFLNNIQGAGNLIEKFKILRFEQDLKQKDRIYLDIHIKPYFPARNFLIKLDGTRGDDPDSAEWASEYAQE